MTRSCSRQVWCDSPENSESPVQFLSSEREEVLLGQQRNRRERETEREREWQMVFTALFLILDLHHEPAPLPLSSSHSLSLSLQIQPFLFLNAPLSLDRAYKPSDIFLSPFDSRFLVIVPQHLIYSKEPPFSHSSGFNDWLLL